MFNNLKQKRLEAKMFQLLSAQIDQILRERSDLIDKVVELRKTVKIQQQRIMHLEADLHNANQLNALVPRISTQFPTAWHAWYGGPAPVCADQRVEVLWPNGLSRIYDRSDHVVWKNLRTNGSIKWRLPCPVIN